MSENSELLNDMIDGFWDHLNGDSRYTDLGLTEFRLTDGNVLTFDEETIRVETTSLPAVAVASVTSNIVDTGLNSIVQDLQIELIGAVIYANTAAFNDHEAILATAAVMTMIDVIGTTAARRARWGVPGGLSSIVWDTGELER